MKSSETSTLVISKTSQGFVETGVPVAVGGEGDHTVAVTGWEVGESDTTGEDIGDWGGKQRFNFGPDSWR